MCECICFSEGVESMEDSLYITDLDGTLFRSNVTVSNYTIEILNSVIKSGYQVTYCTARSHYIANKILGNIQFQIPSIVYNGAFMVDNKTGDSIFSNILDHSIADELIIQGQKIGVTPFLFGFQDTELLLYLSPENEGQKIFINQRQRQGDKRLRQVTKIVAPKLIITLIFIANQEKLIPFKEWAEKFFHNLVQIHFAEDIYSKGYYSLQFSHPNANKGTMIKKLSEYLGVPLSNITVFGDHLNDVEMFDVAGYKIAVGNAHPSILRLADEIINNNDQDGVANYFETKLLRRNS
jgi:Cof subfamily protein (haloacid dehalogenase superfamily)